MLVLTRKHQEKIRIGNDITITVLRTKGKAVRLGIEAPTEIPVIRGELSFDDAGLSGDQEVAEVAVADSVVPPALVHRPGEKVHETRNGGSWSMESHPASVSLQRIPRDKVSSLLPQLTPGTGPLRAMLEMRSTTR